MKKIENNIEKYHPNRFTKKRSHSAQNIASSWKQGFYNRQSEKQNATRGDLQLCCFCVYYGIPKWLKR
jgi:hypothetical protein